jgi:hypothetical protein
VWRLLGGDRPDVVGASYEPAEAGVVRLSVSEVCASRLREAGLHPSVVPDTYGKNPAGPMGRIFVPTNELVKARQLIDAFI